MNQECDYVFKKIRLSGEANFHYTSPMKAAPKTMFAQCQEP